MGGVADPPPPKKKRTHVSFHEGKQKVWAGPRPPGQSLAWYLSSTLPPGDRDSGRLGLSVRTWLAEAATAADLNGGSGGGGEAPEEKSLNLFWAA